MKIAILPFENLTDVPEAPDRVLPYLVRLLLEEGYRLLPNLPLQIEVAVRDEVISPNQDGWQDLLSRIQGEFVSVSR